VAAAAPGPARGFVLGERRSREGANDERHAVMFVPRGSRQQGTHYRGPGVLRAVSNTVPLPDSVTSSRIGARSASAPAGRAEKTSHQPMSCAGALAPVDPRNLEAFGTLPRAPRTITRTDEVHDPGVVARGKREPSELVLYGASNPKSRSSAHRAALRPEWL